jgi:kinesin family member 2/24
VGAVVTLYLLSVDQTFSESESTEDIYDTCIQPLVPFVTSKGGRATVFAYGQTGSGKTYTMMGVQKRIAEDLFASLSSIDQNVEVFVSFFEICEMHPH